MSHRVTPPKEIHEATRPPGSWMGAVSWTCPICNKEGLSYLEKAEAIASYREHIARAHPMF